MQFVDYDILSNNAKYFKSLLGNSKLCAVVKNDAYGHGLKNVAKTLQCVADYFAVGNLDEANVVHEYSNNILILLPQDLQSTLVATEYGYILTLDSFVSLNNLLMATTCLGKNVRVHIKIDSGMSRLGFYYEDLPKLCSMLNDNIKVEGVYSHFADNSCEQLEKQFAYFNKCCMYLQQKISYPLIKHVASTQSALLDKKYHLDMARIGLGLYGYGCESLVPCKTVCAKVVSCKRIKANSSVGYQCKYTCNADTNIAVLDVGYANGYTRAIGKRKVLINGKLYDVVGNVCMGMTMVDVQNDDVAVGSNAVLLGKGLNPANNQVIVYELLCNLR